MSDPIKHECGIAFIRLLKPLEYYREKYGTYLYGLNKLYLLMEKQHNRGQDGAGVGIVKLSTEPGVPYIFRHRSGSSNGIQKIFQHIQSTLKEVGFLDEKGHEQVAKVDGAPYIGNLLLGHLRYGTFSKGGVAYCHPFIRENNWKTKNLVIAGNFNMTNNQELFNKLIELGQHPRHDTDTITVMEKIGHFLDEEVEGLYHQFKSEGMSRQEITGAITQEIDVKKVLRRAAKDFDGGYAIAGMMGHGDAFILRDPNGIRPAFWYSDDEVVVVTSERPAIQTAFSVRYEDVQPIQPGHALIVKRNGEVSEEQIREPGELRQCTFERIYFSRGTDKEIYEERKNLGKLLANTVLEAVNYDFENTVFSYIPNTAELAFLGLQQALEQYLIDYRVSKIKSNDLSPEEQERITRLRPRIEKVPWKDVKLRTFITADAQRKDLVSHVYDTTYGVIRSGQDTLVVLDDSIVRGTTLKDSILRILDRLGPRRIIVVSSAPQIRYPDCYGIDMSKLQDLTAFRAAISLHREKGNETLIEEVYQKCKADISNQLAPNHVQAIYETLTDEEISSEISRMLRPADIQAEVDIIFQTVANLHEACPNHSGDWYFTGNFPTPGGNRVANRAFVNFYEGRDERAY